MVRKRRYVPFISYSHAGNRVHSGCIALWSAIACRPDWQRNRLMSVRSGPVRSGTFPAFPHFLRA